MGSLLLKIEYFLFGHKLFPCVKGIARHNVWALFGVGAMAGAFPLPEGLANWFTEFISLFSSLSLSLEQIRR